jgi:hypothetical protein
MTLIDRIDRVPAAALDPRRAQDQSALSAPAAQAGAAAAKAAKAEGGRS